MKMEPDQNLETVDELSAGKEAAPIASSACPTSFAAGRYEVKRLLGEGGQKQVYLARDIRLKRDVVIALLRTDQLGAQSVTRLRREAQAMAQLGDHPNIVTVHDLGEEAGRPYIVSQYIEGGAVAGLLKAANKRPLALQQALRIAEQVCQALAHAHSRGIVHRDLKPDNVWLTQDGTVKLGDFGIALDLQLSRLTLKGKMVGTVAYMPPEQALGQEGEPRSDLYSLGAMLYEMVTGRPPFLGDQLVGIISQHINTPPVAPSWHNPEMPQALENLILRLLAKAPENRPQSAAAVAQALAAMTSSSGAIAERVAPQDAKSLARLASGVFVGREQEMSRLRAGMNEALSGHGRLLLLVGEPGGGKTRAAEQLATYARLRDAQVLVGRCYEGGGAPAFWPWVQIVRSYAQEREPERLTSVMGPGASDIAQLITEVRERLPNLPAPPFLEPEQARFRLFDSITNFFKNAAKAQVLVVILDDLHWADKPSLLLLEFLAREVRDARLLIVGTYRDVELGRQHPLAQTLAELARQGLSERIILHGLPKPEVARFIEMTAGLDPPETLVAAVYRETEGNPFFVNEIVSLLVSEGRLERPEAVTSWNIRVPEGVREVIGRRLERLSDGCNRILTTASVVGREFGLDVLEPLGELSGDGLLEVLEEAVAARVITEVPRVAGSYSFSHALIRETLYDELSAARRVRLHRRIGELLENIYKSKLEPHLAELAHHFFQAAPGGDVDKAIDYAVQAADRATNLLAYEEAVGHYERALQALELEEEVDEKRRCELFLALGAAQMKAGNTAKGRETFERAADVAGKLGSPAQLARAALGIGTGAVIGTKYGKIDRLEVDLLEKARNALGERDSALGARLLAHLSLALYHLPEERLRLSQQAVEMARRIEDRAALLAALYSRSISLEGFEKAEERLAVATEIVRLAEQAGEKEMALRGHYRRFRELLELGDIPAADQEMETYTRLAEELRQPRYLWLAPFARSSRAMLEGRFEESERLVQQALAIGQRAQDPNATLFFSTQTVTLGRLQGKFEELEAKVKGFVEKYPFIAGWRASLAYIYCELGRTAEARDEFERLAANDFADLPRDGAWVVGIALLAQVCALLRDDRRGATLYELLRPFAGRNIVIGAAAVFYGPVSRHLGLLAATMSRWEEAVKHFEDAIQASARMGARPFTAYSQHEYGGMLLARGQPADRGRALQLIEQSLATAEQLGMKKLVEEVQALRANTQKEFRVSI